MVPRLPPLAVPIVAVCPDAVFGGPLAAAALLPPLPPPQPATARATSGRAAAPARYLMGLLRIMLTPFVVESSMFGSGRVFVVGLESALSRTSRGVSLPMRGRRVVAIGSHHDPGHPRGVVS